MTPGSIEVSAFAEFLDEVLHEGRVLLRARPVRENSNAKALAVLQKAYEGYRLEVAPIPFDGPAALAAGELLWRASFFLLHHEEPESEVDRLLTMPGLPVSAATHLSADMVLRFLPQIHRRARARDPADSLTIRLTQILREWPLSGVLANITEGPATGLEFDGHPALLMLYAERLARKEKPAWMPAGAGWEYVELVWQELGKGKPLAVAEGGLGRD